jgi:hypothetical protein
MPAAYLLPGSKLKFRNNWAGQSAWLSGAWLASRTRDKIIVSRDGHILELDEAGLAYRGLDPWRPARGEVFSFSISE